MRGYRHVQTYGQWTLVGCSQCDYELRTLSANLAIAGALCAAHWNGARFRTAVNFEAIDWWPGCGRSVP